MFYIKRIFFIISIVTLPYIASAQSLSVVAPKTSYRVGDSFAISVSINTGGQSINTVSGQILVPPDILQIVDLRYGNSIVSLWVEKPTVDYAKGIISFTGGTPGGYNGSAGPLLSFGIKTKKIGSPSISLQDINVLLNDGQGTEFSSLKLGSLKLSIAEALPPPPPPTPKPKPSPEKPATTTPPAEVYQPPVDTTAPEHFIPLVSQHPDIADNQYFVSFSAVDKDSGVDRYEVLERSYGLPLWKQEWVSAKSPYVLRHQWWKTIITIRAYDQVDNIVEGVAKKPLHPIILWTGIILLGAISGFLFLYKKKPKTKLRAKRLL